VRVDVETNHVAKCHQETGDCCPLPEPPRCRRHIHRN
jgi:hypothetical protein